MVVVAVEAAVVVFPFLGTSPCRVANAVVETSHVVILLVLMILH